MRRVRIVVLVGLLLNLAGARGSFAQCNPDPFKPDLREPCATIMDRLSQAASTARDFNRQVDQLNNEIGDARSKYWKRYPDKPGYEEAELTFYKELWNKDMYYLMLALPAGMNDRATRQPNVMGLLNGSVSPEDLDKFPKNLDAGIRPYAFSLFAIWVNALRRAEGREETKGDEGNFATPFIIVTALKDRSNWRKAYEDARNWSEFLSSGLDVSKYLTPKAYLLHQMEAGVSLVNAKAKPADLPDPTVATRELYDQFMKMFGEKEVLAAAAAVLHAPKNSVGGLAPRVEVSVGSYSQAPSPNPMMMFFTLVTNASPRNYAISLCMDQFSYPGIEAAVTFNTRETWGKAFSCYEQLVAKYGEANVLSAAVRLKGAEKNSSGGLRGDTQSRSMTGWFQALLKDPKAAIPDAQVAHFRASSYDPHWLGKIVAVRGTVLRVDVAKGQFPPYATIHFKESSGDNITAYTPNSDMWQENYGDNFEKLIGRPVEVYGQVGEWKEGAGVRVISRDQLKLLDVASGLGANFTESKPDWLTEPLPVKKLVDSPKYLAWNKFPVGTTVTYETRLLHEYQPGTNLYARTKISVNTFRLESIDEKRAVVMVSTTVWHLGANSSRTPETKLVYPAKEEPGSLPSATPNESGDETVEISGNKYATHWNSVWQKHMGSDTELDPQSFTKTWTSDGVPSGVVLTHQQSHREIVGKEYRDVTETILMPVANVEPELGSGGGNQLTPGVPAGQATVPNRNNPTPTTANLPADNVAASTQSSPPPVQATLPNTRRGPDPPATRTIPPSGATSPQVEFARHYSVVTTRAARVRAGLARWQRSHGGPNAAFPPYVSAARARMENQFQAVVNAMRARDMATGNQRLNDVESTLTVIEQFLAK
jgi:hypothetical protein